jgi:hypothetical protein
MKKALLVVAAVGLVVWVITWFRAPGAVKASAQKEWPGGRGTLSAVRERFPPLKANDASRKLKALANGMPKSDAVDEYVRAEIARDDLKIGSPPSIPDVSAIRELLLREPVVWERRVGFDDPEVGKRRGLVMTTARALIASALSKAVKSDASAWDDLHAAWNLARSLDGHPQMMLQTAALSIARMINAVAWRMPLPPPAWLAALRERDELPSLVEAFQYQTASYSDSGTQIFPTKMLADSVDRDRGIAEALLKVTRCNDTTIPMNDLGPDERSVWRRAFRYRAEREATANALRARAGKPIVPQSVCAGETWSFDGTTVRFSHEIPLGTDEKPMPLALRVTSSD